MLKIRSFVRNHNLSTSGMRRKILSDILIILGLIVVLLSGCDPTEPEPKCPPDCPTPEVHFSISSPEKTAVSYFWGDTIPVAITLNEGAGAVSGMTVKSSKGQSFQQTGSETSIRIPTDSFTVGQHTMTVKVSYEDGTSEQRSFSLTLYSDEPPTQYSYKVLNVYPHDPTSYTQGLVYHDSKLYEGTGQYGESKLRLLDLKSGQVMKEVKLEDKYFGEGVCVYNDQLIQITWKEATAFVYDRNDLTQIRTFPYPYPMDGWGLTYDGTHLIMSDGTSKLSFLDPETFLEDYHIEVYDNQTPVPQLNELEFIDGLVFANIYQTDNIAIIDPKTGKVKGYINLTGLLPESDRHPQLDVLNGIADLGNSKLLVTGKNWPKMFVIEYLPVP